MPIPAPPRAPVRAFCASAKEDEGLCAELATHLLPFDKIIDCRYQHGLPLGSLNQEMTRHSMEHSQLWLLLLSPDFLASHEAVIRLAVHWLSSTTQAEPGGPCVLPILLRPIAENPFAHLTCLPRDGRAITLRRDRDEAWVEVIKEIQALVERLARPGPRLQPGVDGRIFEVPYLRNLNFIGREEHFAKVDLALREGKRLVVLLGMGGVGKSHFCLEFAYRHAERYRMVWWASVDFKKHHADERTTDAGGQAEPLMGWRAALAAEYARMAAALGLRDRDTRSALRWLEDQGDYLLVVDGALIDPDLDAARGQPGWAGQGDPDGHRLLWSDYLPRRGSGHVLITSRIPGWRTIASEVSLPPFDPAESVRFLFLRTRTDDQEAAAQLAGELGHLPLALEQAAAYIDATGQSLRGYLTLYHQRPRELRRLNAVAAAGELSFRALRAGPAAQPAVALMTLCSLLAPDPIPLDQLERWAPFMPRELARCLGDTVRRDQVIRQLRRYSLIERSEAALSMHPLLQAVVRDRLRAPVLCRWTEAVLSALLQGFNFHEDDPSTWDACALLLRHALAVARGAYELLRTSPPGKPAVSPTATMVLLNRTGLYLENQAEHEEAARILQWALDINERWLGQEHPSLVIRLTNLADTERLLGRHDRAESLLNRAYQLAVRSLGSDHPIVACVSNNLALLMDERFSPDEAYRRLTETVAILRARADASPLHLARALNNLGLLEHRHEPRTAKSYLLQGRQIAELDHPCQHPVAAAISNNLGYLAQSEGKLNDALSFYRGSLHDLNTYQRQHQPHPATVCVLHNISLVEQDLGHVGEASATCEEAILLARRIYGEEHPILAGLKETLGGIQFRRGMPDIARGLVEEAIAIFENTFGPNHRRTQDARSALRHMFDATAPLPFYGSSSS